METTPDTADKAIIIGLDDGSAEWRHSFDELVRLAETAGAEVVGELVQKRNRPDAQTYLGSGKLAEMGRAAAELGADMVICDDELSPTQQREMEKASDLRVIDRTALILDIFAQHATSAEGKLQVEMAQLDYALTRMKGKGVELSRIGGGIGIRMGGGETKLEIDRRRARERLGRLKRELAELEKHRARQRRKRARSDEPSIALVGYTNSGKSSLLKALTGSQAYIDDKLFATLDSLTRRYHWQGRGFIISDTVGFVDKLPHQLVAAFHSTLEVAVDAELLCLVVDAAAPDAMRQRAASLRVLEEIGATDKPLLTILNKADIADAEALELLKRRLPDCLAVSARTGSGIEELRDAITVKLSAGALKLVVPADEAGGAERLLAGSYSIIARRWTADSLELTVRPLAGREAAAEAAVSRWAVSKEDECG